MKVFSLTFFPNCDDFQGGFYHSLTKRYVLLVLERFCLALYRQERFVSHHDLEIARNSLTRQHIARLFESRVGFDPE
jgi:hypothetical protein